MRDVEPDFWRNLREELAADRQWVDRSVVLGYAALTCGVVVGLSYMELAALLLPLFTPPVAAATSEGTSP